MQKDSMDVLLDLLSDLSCYCDELNNEDRNRFYKSFREIYSNEEFRHSYAVLSHFAEEKITPDSRDGLVTNLDLILSYADEHYDSQIDKRSIKGIGKLADHLELENLRLSRIEQIKIIGEKVSLEKSQAEILIKDNTEKIQSQQEEIKNMNTQMVSVLGIFSAVVLAFFGGLSYFTSAFSNLNNIPLSKALMLASILGLVICDTIYMLLNFILSIIRQDKLIQKRAWGDFSIKFVNIALILIFIASAIMWIAKFDPELPKDNSDDKVISSIVENE